MILILITVVVSRATQLTEIIVAMISAPAERVLGPGRAYTRSPLEDSRVFGPSPRKILALVV